MERNHLCNFARGHYGEHSIEIILNLGQWFRRRCHLKKKFTHDGQTLDEDSPGAFGSGELKTKDNH